MHMDFENSCTMMRCCILCGRDVGIHFMGMSTGVVILGNGVSRRDMKVLLWSMCLLLPVM